jgi:hypothetical protein
MLPDDESGFIMKREEAYARKVGRDDIFTPA